MNNEDHALEQMVQNSISEKEVIFTPPGGCLYLTAISILMFTFPLGTFPTFLFFVKQLPQEIAHTFTLFFCFPLGISLLTIPYFIVVRGKPVGRYISVFATILLFLSSVMAVSFGLMADTMSWLLLITGMLGVVSSITVCRMLCGRSCSRYAHFCKLKREILRKQRPHT